MTIAILDTPPEQIQSPLNSIGSFVRIAFAMLVTSLISSSAEATLREYRVEFLQSASSNAAGYFIYVGTSPGNYVAEFDLGSPPTSGGTVVYAVDLEEYQDLFVALRTYDESGEMSDYSNEIRIPAVVFEPPPPSGAGGDGDDSGVGDGAIGGDGNGSGAGVGDGASGDVGDGAVGDSGSDSDVPMTPGTILDGAQLGLAAANDGLISAFLSDGNFDSLTMDSLAAAGGIRPVQCDLDGDADLDIVVGFGQGSGGQIALIFLEDGAVSSVTSILAGPDPYRQRSGETAVACGDLDGDGRGELVVGFGFRMRGTVQIFDDVQTGFQAFDAPTTNEEGYMQPPVPNNFWGGSYPAIGDIDGDGRNEIVIGLGRTSGGGRLIVLDDLSSDFEVHPANQTGDPWIEINPADVVNTRRTKTFPSLGDLDGDGRDEIVVAFGMGSSAVVAVLEDVVEGFPINPENALRIATGRARYRMKDGETRVSIGDVDGDVAEELVVSFKRDGNHEVQIFDDLISGMAPMTADDGFVVSAASSSINGVIALPMN